MTTDQDGLMQAPELLSPSSISTFQQCPMKFKYSKIDGLRDSPTEATMLGNFVHEILETMYALPSEQRTQETARQLARDLWAVKWEAEVTTLIRGEKELRLFRWSAWWCVENLWMLEQPQEVEPWGIEEHVEGEISGIKLHGFIDRLHLDGDTAKVSDYKTGKTPKKNYIEDKYFQLIIYTQLLKSLGIEAKKFEIELLYLKDGVRFAKEVTAEDVQKVASVIAEVRAGIEERCKNGYFEPNKTILCNWCGFKKICPAWQ
jgi:putative RecB family exonuclease